MLLLINRRPNPKTDAFARRNSPPLWQRQMDIFRDDRQDPMIREFAQRIPKDSQNGVMIKKAVLTLLLASGKIRKMGPKPAVA